MRLQTFTAYINCTFAPQVNFIYVVASINMFNTPVNVEQTQGKKKMQHKESKLLHIKKDIPSYVPFHLLDHEDD